MRGLGRAGATASAQNLGTAWMGTWSRARVKANFLRQGKPAPKQSAGPRLSDAAPPFSGTSPNLVQKRPRSRPSSYARNRLVYTAAASPNTRGFAEHIKGCARPAGGQYRPGAS